MTAPESPPPAPPRRWFGPRLLLLLLLAGAVLAFYLTGLHRELSWNNLRARLDDVKGWVADHLLAAALAYFGIYVVVTSLSLPAASVLSLVGGALFGVWLGTGIVSIAATLGASIAMLLCRYLIGDWVQRRWGHRLEALNRGIEKDGAYYLLTLRLVPVFPFFLINLGMGLTRMPLRTFVWVSWLGMLPGTFLYLYFGQELSRINSPGDVFSRGVLIALGLLATVPLLLKWLLRGRGVAGGGEIAKNDDSG
jgi:uncharacterized membrane protein YdjX (TVP38/TMEM64 family)